jgi:hypothetical protein
MDCRSLQAERLRQVWDRSVTPRREGSKAASSEDQGAVVGLRVGVPPGSQIALRPPQSVESLMNQTLQFKSSS